jgi:hypothetical protein
MPSPRRSSVLMSGPLLTASSSRASGFEGYEEPERVDEVNQVNGPPGRPGRGQDVVQRGLSFHVWLALAEAEPLPDHLHPADPIVPDFRRHRTYAARAHREGSRGRVVGDVLR